MVSITAKVVNAEIVRQGLENFGAEVPKVGRQRLYLTMLRIKTRLSKAPPKSSGPVNWDSPKQRRAYFATDGFYGGIPYRRRGTYERAWIIQRVDDGYKLFNDFLMAVHITGDIYGRGQSRIHADRWPMFKTVSFEEMRDLPDELFADVEKAKKKSGLS